MTNNIVARGRKRIRVRMRGEGGGRGGGKDQGGQISQTRSGLLWLTTWLDPEGGRAESLAEFEPLHYYLCHSDIQKREQESKN